MAAWPTADELADEADRRRRVMVTRAGLPETPESESLVAAADQFLVQRASTGGPTVIAGYHWFGDWGRDTMISLPGLTLTTRRFEGARGILRTFARYVDQGMLPNRFPDSGEMPEYNTVDATLWWLHALDRYHRATDDDDLLREQFPLLQQVIDWHVRGTRHGIKVDPEDGLLLAGAPGVQLTWMDARIGDWVVTPRYGKPVEVNALWLNALSMMARFADHLSQDGAEYRYLAARARNGMQRFWSEEHGYLYDVIGPDGVGDASLRPNQLFAFSLPTCAFSHQQGEAVLKVVQEQLLTPYGPRSLAPGADGYDGRYAGDSYHRDSVYHQGAVWPWLLGAYADALVNLRGLTPATRAELRERIAPLMRHLDGDACLGSVSEIFVGDAPHAPNGAVAQAWSVAELLRIYAMTVAPAAAVTEMAPALVTV
jgi:predicted glycogen debranching enzyme